MLRGFLNRYFTIFIASMAVSFGTKLPVQFNVFLYVGAPNNIRINAMVVVWQSTRRRLAHGDGSVVEDAAVLTLHGVVTRQDSALRWPVKLVVGPDGVLLLVAANVLFDDGQVHVPLGPIGKISQCSLRLAFLTGGAAASE